MELNLTGKVAVISGGGTGIGKALALEYLKEGVQVCTFGRRLAVLEKFAQECRAAGYEIYYEQLDITDTKGLESYAARVFEKFGHLDIWVNNAGVDCVKEFSQFTQADWDRVMKINLEGVFHGTQIAAEYMKKSGGGVILNASSYARLIPHANSVIYAASKSAVSSLTRSTAAALAPYGIRVIAYIPGMIETEINTGIVADYREKFTKDISLKRLGKPEDLAKPLVFLSSECASFITGCDIEITGGKFAVQDCDMAWRFKNGETK